MRFFLAALAAILTLSSLTNLSWHQDVTYDRALPAGVFNVARAEFGITMSNATVVELGEANLFPIGIVEKDDSFGRGPKIYIFRTPRPLFISRGQTVRFTLKIGETDELYIWPESAESAAKWSIVIKEKFFDGYTNELFNRLVSNNQLQFVPVHKHTEIEISIGLNRHFADNRKSLTFTASPRRLLENVGGRLLPRSKWDRP